MRVPSTLEWWLGNWDQLPDLGLVGRDRDPPYTLRHRPKALPPFPFPVLLPQIINDVGGSPPMLVLKRTGQLETTELAGRVIFVPYL